MLARGQITVTNLDDGIGVKGVTGYYLASPLSEGIRKDTPGWTTEMQPLTPENKYLWNKEIIHYTDDESALKDKTEVLSGTEIFTDKADADAVVHVEIDGKSYQHAGSGKNLFNKRMLADRDKYTHGTYSASPTFQLKPNTNYTLSAKEVKPSPDGFQLVLNVMNATNGAPLWGDSDYSSNIIRAIFNRRASGLSSLSQTFTTPDSGIISFSYFDSRNGQSPEGNWFTDVMIEPQLEEGSTATPYEPPAPTPDYPIEIHSLNDFDVVSSVGKKNLLSNTGNIRQLSNNNATYPIEDEAFGLYRRLRRLPGENNALSNYTGTFYDAEIGKNYTQSIEVNPEKTVTLRQRSGASTICPAGQWTTLYVVVTATSYKGRFWGISGNNVFDENGNGIWIQYRNEKVEEGNISTPYSPAPENITESDNHSLIDKTNILLSEPLRSVGNVKDRLYRDSDGLWKIERNVEEYYFDGSEGWEYRGVTNSNKTLHVFYVATFLKNTTDKLTSSHFKFYGKTGGISDMLSQSKEMIAVYSSHGGTYMITSHSSLNEFKSWLSDNNVQVQYELKAPPIETLNQELQDKLNNLRSFQGSNYVYTIVDKTNILPNYVSENLKPNLHATFKSKAWSGNNAGYPSVIGVYGDSAKMLYLSATAESMTFNADGTPNPSSQVITLTANLQNVSGNASFVATAYNGSTVVSDVALSGVGNTRTFNQAQFPASANRVQVRATLGNLVDTVTIVKLANGSKGQNAVVGLLTNESITLPANKDGSVSSFVGATGIFDVYDGITKKTGSGVTYSLVSQSNITVSINATTGAYSITAMPTGTTILNGYATLKAIYNGVTIEKQLNVSKSVTGATGATGSTGAPGVSSYTWIRYSPNANGSAMTTTPEANSLYIGVATTTTNSAPTDYKQYSWALIKGADGRGVKSTSVSYQKSASGTTTPTGSWVATIPSVPKGEYLWTRMIITYTDSTTSTTYNVSYQGVDGSANIVGLLTNEAITLPANASGSVSSYAGANGVFEVYDGITKKTGTSVTYSVLSKTNIEVTISTTGGYTVTSLTGGLSVMSGYATLRAVYGGVTIDKQISVAKSTTGGDGASATSYWITASNNIIGKSQTGVINPTTITFKGFSKTGTANSVAYSGRFIIQTSTNGTTYTTKYTSSANQNTYTYTIPADSLFVKCKFYQAGGTTILLDEQTVPVVETAEGIEIGGRNRALEPVEIGYNIGSGLSSSNAYRSFTTAVLPIGEYIISHKTDMGVRLEPSANVMFLEGSGVYNFTKPLRMKVTTESSFNVSMRKSDTSDLGDEYLTLEEMGLKLEKGNKATDWTPAPEDARTYSAWANSPDGKVDFTRVKPNENLVLDSSRVRELVGNDKYNQSSYIYKMSKPWKDLGLKLGDTFTATFDLEIEGEVANGIFRLQTGEPWTTVFNATYLSNLKSEKSRYSQNNTLTNADLVNSENVNMGVRLDNVPTGTKVFLSDFKLEIGGKTIYTTNPQDSLTGSVPQYIGFSPLDSDKPEDYAWTLNPEWVKLSSMNYKAWASSPDGMVGFTRVHPGPNLFSISSVTEGSYINVSGTKVNDAAWATSDYILVEDYKNLTASGFTNLGTAPSVGFYTESQSFVKGIANGGSNINQSIKIDENIKYIRFSVLISDIPTLKIEPGTMPTQYVTSEEDSPSGSVMQYLGLSNQDSTNPHDFIWMVSPAYSEREADAVRLWANSYITKTQTEIMSYVGAEFESLDGKYVESTTFSQEMDKFNFIFNLPGELDEIRDSTDGRLTEIEKYIRFENGNIYLGSSNSDSQLVLKQDKIEFVQGGEIVAFLEGQSFYFERGTILENLQIGDHKITNSGNGRTDFQYIGK